MFLLCDMKYHLDRLLTYKQQNDLEGVHTISTFDSIISVDFGVGELHQ